MPFWENDIVTHPKSQVPQVEQVAAWLQAKFGGAVEDLAPLSGGFWSSAFTFRVGLDEFVLRLSELSEGFTIDAAAMRFIGPNLPIPEVLETGEALGLPYAISRRHVGRFVETTEADEGRAVGEALASLLAALRAVPGNDDEGVFWYDSADSGMTWHGWLRAGLIDNPKSRVSGWRGLLAADPRVDRLFAACEQRIEQLLPACPERRDLVHGDLLHQNVLVSEDASTVTAIFSWKCSVRGDFLFDVAWCTFWGDWHPGIAAAGLWQRTLAAPDLVEADLVDASLRHHCYELQIAASHFGWNAWTGDLKELQAVADAAERVLSRGPLPDNRRQT